MNYLESSMVRDEHFLYALTSLNLHLRFLTVGPMLALSNRLLAWSVYPNLQKIRLKL